MKIKLLSFLLIVVGLSLSLVVNSSSPPTSTVANENAITQTAGTYVVVSCSVVASYQAFTVSASCLNQNVSMKGSSKLGVADMNSENITIGFANLVTTVLSPPTPTVVEKSCEITMCAATTSAIPKTGSAEKIDGTVQSALMYVPSTIPKNVANALGITGTTCETSILVSNIAIAANNATTDNSFIVCKTAAKVLSINHVTG